MFKKSFSAGHFNVMTTCIPGALHRTDDGTPGLGGLTLAVSIQRIQRRGNTKPNVLDVQLQEECPLVLGARELTQGNLLQNLLRRGQDLLVQGESLLRPVFPGVLVAEPEEDGPIHCHGLDEDQRPVQRDVDEVRVRRGRGGRGRLLTLERKGSN